MQENHIIPISLFQHETMENTDLFFKNELACVFKLPLK